MNRLVFSRFFIPRSSSFLPFRNFNFSSPHLSSPSVNVWINKYEDIIGLKEVKFAQNKVIDAERNFQQIQEKRRNCQLKLTLIQNRLKELHGKLESLQRGDEKYLALLTEEYEILKNEKNLVQELKKWEQSEHDHFAYLSSALRESHEKERVRAERTKYWSVIGSIIGAFLGIFGSSINNYVKMKELRNMVDEGNAKNNELRGLIKSLSSASQAQYGQTVSFLSDLHTLLRDGSPSSSRSKFQLPLKFAYNDSTVSPDVTGQEILDHMKTKNSSLEKEAEIVEKLMKVPSKGTGNGVEERGEVILGPELNQMLERMENDLEWKIKKNALFSSFLLYGVTFGIGFIIYKIISTAS